MPNGKRLVVRIEPELFEAVRAKAKKEDLTISQVVRRLLRSWIADDPPQAEQESKKG